MALTVANNVASLTAQLNLNRTSSNLSTSLERLSTGLKINRGADGPAALVISEQQRAQIVGLQTAIANTSKAVNLVQTGEGALNEVNSLLSQARSLALDSANTGINDQNALNANQAQLANILSTIDNIANTTQFGQKKLLNGSAGLAVTQSPTGYSVSGTGATVGGTYTLGGFTAAVKANALAGSNYAAVVNGTSDATVVINGVNIALNAANAGGGSAAAALANVVGTINGFSSQTGVTAVINGSKLQLVSNSFGSAGNFTLTTTGANGAALLTALGYAGNVTTSSSTNGTAATNAAGTLTDANGTYTGAGNGNTLTFSTGDSTGLSVTFAASGTTGTVGANADVIKFVNNSLTFQIGANAGQTASVAFNSANTTAIGQNAQGVVNGAFTSLNALTINTTQSDAQDAIRVIDKAIQDITNQRGTLGAFQANTLTANSHNLQTALQNTTAAESTIRDTDFAAEISTFTRTQVQLQAGASVLGSSNQIPGIVTQLLQKL